MQFQLMQQENERNEHNRVFVENDPFCERYRPFWDAENQEVLVDRNGAGKDRKWSARKRRSLEVSQYFCESQIGALMEFGHSYEDAKSIAEELGEELYWVNQGNKVNNCANVLEFIKYKSGERKLYRAFFCKNRLCPMCNWRRSVKFIMHMMKILAEMERRKIETRPIFLTLTLKNVKGEDIGKCISELSAAFGRLVKYKAVKDYCLGGVRMIETTYNKKRDDYHPHIHCILFMTPGYFKGGAYLSQKVWTELWKKAAKLDYTPIVNVKTIKPKGSEGNGKQECGMSSIYAAVLEVCKYPVKPNTFVREFVKVYGEGVEEEQKRLKGIHYLSNGIFRKRLVVTFGIIKQISRELGQDDIEDGDLLGVEGMSNQDSEIVQIDRFDFNRGKKEYCKVASREISMNELPVHKRKKKCDKAEEGAEEQAQ